MRIGVANSHPRKTFHVRRMNLYIVGIAGEILIRARVAHSHVVRHHENDVGLLCSKTRSREEREKENSSTHCENRISQRSDKRY